MIEENILKWLELGDSIQKIEIYNKRILSFTFYMYYLLSKHAHFSQYFHIFIMFLSFAQIWELNLLKVKIEGDSLLEIINYFEKIFLFHKTIVNANSFRIVINIALLIYCLLFIISIIFIILLSKKIKHKYLIVISSFLNLLFIYYINGPLLLIFFFPILCYTRKEVNFYCFMTDYQFFMTMIFCIIFTFFLVYYVIASSLYVSDIGCINNYNEKSKTSSNYITLIVVIKIFLFWLSFVITFITNNIIVTMLYYLVFFLANCGIRFYINKNVFYYNQKINNFHNYGWSYSIWFSFCIILKVLLKIKDITLFVIFGIILITFELYFHSKNLQFKILTELNLFECKSFKDIEIFNEILMNLSKDNNNYKNKALVAGTIKRFEETFKNNPELKEQYTKIINDKYLLKKFNSSKELKILSIISIIYSYNIEKSKDIADITLHMCYFLINNFKNPLYAIWLCTKVKAKTHIQLYYKYTLMEEIKEYLIRILNKNKNKLSIKHIQISSVILYNQYINLFKMKIYDAICSQIEYFDILKNNITTKKTTENFLHLGEDILSLKRDIMGLWDKIISLNPFNNESEKDYMIYLDAILQDDILKKSEIKKFNRLREEKISEKNNLYYSMFNQVTSAVLLSDGYSNSSKIIYATPNFPSLFMFTGKEILNTSVDDLLPDVVQNFHKFLIEDAIKYSNLSYIFHDKRNVLLKGKTGEIFNIYLYVKPVPDLTFGLIYFLYIEKIKQQNFIIILDEDFIINGFTETNFQTGTNFTINNNYGLSKIINGWHIGMIIPDILLQMDYDEESNSYYFIKNNIELKGTLYNIHSTNNLDTKIEKIMEIIKERKLSNDNKYGSFEEYDDFIKTLKKKNSKIYSIYFRIVTHSFMGGKFKYYRIYVIDDILFNNDKSIDIQSYGNSASAEINNNFKETKVYKSKIKNNEDSSIFGSGTKTIKKGNISKQNIIKLKTILNRKSKILIKGGIYELNNDFNNKEINLKEEDSNKQNLKDINSNINNKNLSQGLNSNQNQTKMESAEINKLKNEIQNKNDSFYIKLIKIISIIFLIFMFILMIIDYTYISLTADLIIKFFQENVFFPYTKICMACIYNAVFNLYLIKENVTLYCPNGNCTSFYAKLLTKCYTELRIQKYDINSFFPDYLDIFSQKLNAELYIYNDTRIDHLNLDIDMFLNLVLAGGLKIIANLTDFLDNNPNNELKVKLLKIYVKNLLIGALKYFYSDYDGFYGEEKEIKCFKAASNSPIRIIISNLLWVLVFCVILFSICKKNRMEIYFLDRLINFTSSNFDEYLKNLEELKKKFRDDSNNEEDKNMDELDIGIDDIDGEKNNENNSKNEKDIDINDKNKDNKTKEIPNKKKNIQNKILQQRIKKKKIMSDYFKKYNIYFGLKISIILLISTTFFVVTLGNIESMKNSHKKFDSNVEAINNAFFKYFQTFLIFKEQIQKLYNEKDKSKFLIPQDTEIEKPKLGNSLIYFISYKYSKKNLKLFEKLYNDNACQVLNTSETEYKFCEQLFSSVLTKGLEQTIVQMGIILTSCVEELNTLKGNKTFKEIYSFNSAYANYEIFMGYYMVEYFLLTQDIFEAFRNDEKKNIQQIIAIILVLYFILYIILIILFSRFIKGYKKVENSLLKFIGILPSKFITDDESFYKSILLFGEYYY